MIGQSSAPYCHCEERSDAAIRIPTLQVFEFSFAGERIATPVCPLARNDSVILAPAKNLQFLLEVNQHQLIIPAVMEAVL